MKKGWEYKKLGEVCERITDGSHNPPQGVEKSHNYMLSSQNVQNGYLDMSSVRYLSDESFKKENQRTQAKKGDVLLTIVGTIGRTCILDGTEGNITFQRSVAILKPSKEINSRFLMYFLLSQNSKLNSTAQGAAQKGIYLKQLGNLELHYPPLSEQKEIVEYLDSSFAKIDKLKENAAKNLEEAKALFQSALKDALEPKEGWEEKYLKDISEYSIGLTYKPTNVCEDGTIVLRSSNIQGGKLDLSDIVRVNAPIKDKLYVQYGDILMCSRNGSAKLVGKVCLIPKTKEPMTYGTFMMIIRSQYNPLLYYYFDSNDFRKQIKHGEANMINQITRYMLDDVKVKLPPLSEQQSIVSHLDSLNEKVNTLQQNYSRICDECDALKQAILRQVFE